MKNLIIINLLISVCAMSQDYSRLAKDLNMDSIQVAELMSEGINSFDPKTALLMEQGISEYSEEDRLSIQKVRLLVANHREQKEIYTYAKTLNFEKNKTERLKTLNQLVPRLKKIVSFYEKFESQGANEVKILSEQTYVDDLTRIYHHVVTQMKKSTLIETIMYEYFIKTEDSTCDGQPCVRMTISKRHATEAGFRPVQASLEFKNKRLTQVNALLEKMFSPPLKKIDLTFLFNNGIALTELQGKELVKQMNYFAEKANSK